MMRLRGDGERRGAGADDYPFIPLSLRDGEMPSPYEYPYIPGFNTA